MIYSLIFGILLALAAFLAFKMAVADWRRRIIPDAYLFPFMLIGLLVLVFGRWPVGITDGVLGGALGYGLGAGIGFLFSVIRKNSHKNDEFPPIGMGDIKLLAAGGIWLGTMGLAMATMGACVLGGLWGMRRRARFIPFAPFFMVGAIIALLGLWFLL